MNHSLLDLVSGFVFSCYQRVPSNSQCHLFFIRIAKKAIIFLLLKEDYLQYYQKQVLISSVSVYLNYSISNCAYIVANDNDKMI